MDASEDQAGAKTTHWNYFYKSNNLVDLPSQFAVFCLGEKNPDIVVDVGCGNGRDSFYFASRGIQTLGVDGSHSAIALCEGKKAEHQVANISFLQGDIADHALFDQIVERIEASGPVGEVLVYARFLVHAINEVDQELFLAHIAQLLMRYRGTFATEFRTPRDRAQEKVTPAHYRRFVSPASFVESAALHGMRCDYSVDGFGFAKYKADDAHVARLLFSRNHAATRMDFAGFWSAVKARIAALHPDLMPKQPQVPAFIRWLRTTVGNVEAGEAKARADIVVDVLVQYLLQGDVAVAEMYFSHANANSQSSIRDTLSLLSDEFFSKRSLALTKHGPLRTFQFWSKEEKAAYLRMANQAVSDLQPVFPNVVFGFGVVLGVERAGDLIPHDDDVDLIVIADPTQFSTIKAAMVAVMQQLELQGWTIYGDYPSHRKISKHPHKLGVDVFVGVREEDYVSFLPGPRRKIRFNDVFPGKSRILHGETVLFPANPEGYLSTLYGPDWRVPKPSWNHSWSDKEFTDLI